MKKGCLIFLGGAAALMLIVVAGSFALWQNKDAILESIQEATAQPEHGKKEYIESRYGSIIATIESAAKDCSSIEELKTRLTNDPNLTKQVLYVACKNDGSDERKLIKRLEWQAHRASTSGNYGSGSLKASGQSTPISIYRRKEDWGYMDTLIVYFKYSETEDPTAASDTL